MTRAAPAPRVFFGVPLGLVMAVAGSLGPWTSEDIEVFGQSDTERNSGLGDGGGFVIVLTLAAAALLLLWRDRRRASRALAGAAGAGAAAVVCILEVAAVDGRQQTALGEVTVGWGLWLALVGSFVLTLVALWLPLRHGRGRAS